MSMRAEWALHAQAKQTIGTPCRLPTWNNKTWMSLDINWNKTATRTQHISMKCQIQSVHWVGYRLDNPGFEFWQGQTVCLFSQKSTMAVGPTQSVIPWAPEFFPWLKWLGHKVDDSPPSSAEVKNEWICTSALPICFHIVNRDNYTCLHNTPHALQHVLTHKVITSWGSTSINKWCLITNPINYTWHTIVYMLYLGLYKSFWVI
jgi:hypothetical protein